MEYKEFIGKTVSDALTNATVSLGVTSDQIKYEVIEEGSTGFLGIGSKDAVIKVFISNDEDPKQVASDFLKGVFEAMQLEVNISMELEESDNTLSIDLAGPEMGVLIGKRGQTLDSLQYLTNLAVNRTSENYTRVKIDTEDYRRRRKETLENLAKNMANKVKRTKKPVTLEAMNPYERRIIHSALQNDNNVTTHSEGEEPYRYVVFNLHVGIVLNVSVLT
ncbi:MAG: protein jag, partial [Pseudobutyrivibrio sp.]|nr:protein jag [Pseudobutyrivibrio sp.]